MFNIKDIDFSCIPDDTITLFVIWMSMVIISIGVTILLAMLTTHIKEKYSADDKESSRKNLIISLLCVIWIICSIYKYVDVNIQCARMDYGFWGNFNDNRLTSDMTEDECYLLVTGKTKAQYEESKRKSEEEYRRREEEFKRQIPELCKAYEKDAESRISVGDMDYFKEILPVRVGDLYHGMEIRCLFEIIDALNSGGLKAAESKFDEQGHSGMSAGLVASLVRRFHHGLGESFYQKIYKRMH